MRRKRLTIEFTEKEEKLIREFKAKCAKQGKSVRRALLDLIIRNL